MSKIPFVNSNCIGCGACVAISPDVFDLNDEGMSIVKELANYDGLSVDDSIGACPVDAISWKEYFAGKRANNPDFAGDKKVA
ncbi:MAG: ferredoxin [Candidatus Gracilibacteria bacterium]|nr:ferredoxin [Candidatus Gracilibacteria bacterium]